MKIPEMNPIQLNRSNEQHFGNSRIVPLTYKVGEGPVTSVGKVTRGTEAVSVNKSSSNGIKSFQDYLLEAVNSVNSQQNAASKLSEKMITDPDSIDIHDVTIAMSKARMSLNLAQNVIDRLVTGWNEITTTR